MPCDYIEFRVCDSVPINTLVALLDIDEIPVKKGKRPAERQFHNWQVVLVSTMTYAI